MTEYEKRDSVYQNAKGARMIAADLLSTAQHRKDTSGRQLRLLQGLLNRTTLVERELKRHRDEVK